MLASRSVRRTAATGTCFLAIVMIGLAVNMVGCERAESIAPNADVPATFEVLKENATSGVGSYFSVIVVQSEPVGDRYCLVPPFGRNPFASGSLERIQTCDSILALSTAIKSLPADARVAAGDPRLFEPTKHRLRSLTKKEFAEIKMLLKE